MTVTFALDPKAPRPEQVIIFRDGIEIERCALADRHERLAPHGYHFAQVPRNGFTASGRAVSRKIARFQQGGA
jgi:hypothetical protein